MNLPSCVSCFLLLRLKEDFFMYIISSGNLFKMLLILDRKELNFFMIATRQKFFDKIIIFIITFSKIKEEEEKEHGWQ
jgi:hypothetical protein